MPRRGTTQELERNRLLAARMFDEQLQPLQIARILNVDDQSVRRWQRIYRVRGRDGLRGRKPPGARTKLSGEQKQQLLQLLKAQPNSYGLDGWLWTSKLVATLIEQRFAVRYHHDHVGVLLHELGWSYQRPARRARERDEPQIQAWREKLWPELLKKVPTPTQPSSLPMRSASS
jgi:transposase